LRVEVRRQKAKGREEVRRQEAEGRFVNVMLTIRSIPRRFLDKLGMTKKKTSE
jgi:hypothetical protein